jgi:hypothetical protein
VWQRQTLPRGDERCPKRLRAMMPQHSINFISDLYELYSCLPVNDSVYMLHLQEDFRGTNIYRYNLPRYILLIANFYFIFFNSLGWGETESTWYVGNCWRIVPAPDVQVQVLVCLATGP